MSNKLHELLAVEQSRKHEAAQFIGSLKKAFTKDATRFDGLVKRYIPLVENAEVVPDETKAIVSTIQELLEETTTIVTKGIDTHISKEETNVAEQTRAELIVEGENFGIFSATSLLALEGHLSRIKDLYQAIPTLDTAKKFHFDKQDNVYKTEAEVKFRSIKKPKVIVKYEATEKHPAQTELLYLDEQVGKYETVYASGRLALSQKSQLLKRIDALLEGVRIARSKANNAEVNNIKIGQRLFHFIHKEVL